MGIILWIIMGGIVGWLASIIMRTRGGVVLDITIGIIGSVIGGALMSVAGAAPATGFSVYNFLVALLGSIILLAIVKAASGRSVIA